MRYATIPGGKQIPRLGLGTWNIGGGMSANRSRDREYIATLEAAIEMGYVHIDTAEMYGAGHTEELVGRAAKRFHREELFITTKVSPSHLRYLDLKKSMDDSLKRLDVDYVDLYLIHWPSGRIPIEESFNALNELVESGKTRYLGVSNFNLPELKEAQFHSETPIVTNQIPYSIHSREYSRNGVVEYCQAEGILITAYSPIKTVSLRSREIDELARKYQATAAQISLAWILHQPGMITIPKSSNQGRLKENLESLELQISVEDMVRLNNMTG